MKSITLTESYFEHLLSCLANQKFIHHVNADGISMGKQSVENIQAEMQQTIDVAYHEGMVLLYKNRGPLSNDIKEE